MCSVETELHTMQMLNLASAQKAQKLSSMELTEIHLIASNVRNAQKTSTKGPMFRLCGNARLALISLWCTTQRQIHGSASAERVGNQLGIRVSRRISTTNLKMIGCEMSQKG